MTLTQIGRGSRPSHDRSRRDPSAPWRHVDPALLVCTAAIAVLGIVMVSSATRGPEAPFDYSLAMRQALFVFVGAGAAFVAVLVDYRTFRDWAWVPYLGVLALLVAVLTPLGLYVNGAQRWIDLGPFQMQPSEFTKLALIVALAALLATWAGDVGPRHLFVSLVVVGIPSVLVLVQPDLGTVLEFIAIAMALLLVGCVPARYLFLLAFVGLAGATLVLTSDTLAEYQTARLTGFINPELDVQGVSYNQNQSITAVASGGATGQGLGQGQQTQLGFVPEHQTDFIFTVVAEELGFVGGVVLLGLYSVVCWRIWRVAHLARDLFGTLVCVGVLVAFVFQIFANIGMATGIMPVTGIPLPLVSYGGSSTVTMFLMVGLVLNVHMRRFR